MLLAFLKELFQRFATKSPKFFKVWQWVFGTLTAVTGIPELLNSFNITLPSALSIFENKAVAFASAGAFFMSLLTTQSKPIGVTEVGDIVKKTNEDKLPFTAQSEIKTAEKLGVTEIPVKTVPLPYNKNP